MKENKDFQNIYNNFIKNDEKFMKENFGDLIKLQLYYLEPEKILINKDKQSVFIIEDNVRDNINYVLSIEKALSELNSKLDSKNKNSINLILHFNFIPYPVMLFIIELKHLNIFINDGFIDDIGNFEHIKSLTDAKKLGLI